MKAIFAYADRIESPTWIAPLQAALPEVEFHHWRPDGPPVGAELAIVWNPPRDLLRREPGVRAVFNLGAGVDALLGLDGLRDDIQLVRLEDAGMAVQMAEYAAYALIRASRQFDVYEGVQASGTWAPQPAIRRKEWTVGVLGMGVMGARVAQTLAAMDYPVAGWSRSGKALPGIESFGGREQLPAFLARTRVLVNTLPLTDDTRNFLCRETLSQLMQGSYLVNIGRGDHLVEEDLLALLETGHLKGATLDVFRTEPLPSDHPFWTHPAITITPHVAAASLKEESVTQIADKVRVFMRGERPTGLVARSKGY
ncbi:2-hydroxyacid dehydrogenase [Allopusillimonas ginsengisoli]|uniref:2-hydroxyacid dehydrogenase n=1 Tax=Allopusillimonas ginsengisoli TaxID=453575 RepID=UPI00101F6E7C|nr:glyoxylate/hydroxypyruvate reductase A [Allopusillimonas ginsengisoli]TEA77801.1 glyoxylate/hydroxypyruvate reductase A [Allopusillimonas ginsengisoli]